MLFKKTLFFNSRKALQSIFAVLFYPLFLNEYRILSVMSPMMINKLPTIKFSKSLKSQKIEIPILDSPRKTKTKPTTSKTK
ncbi:hypothetical protein LMOf2365_1266 [Listeria monocytogenes serotype 4b str. F2365]|nr:hypothetical protein LMOf2365_1266 [Listeria monocytogenes serotype 4b str. F2365]EEW18622.1 conserved hypothetical protein [Listeria monocytogenes FSL R2-503]EFF96022.1 conserved hypothetical protein [Listeria monocytogenes HPB2262]EFG01689.1 conserved hypothetical protein [Listeria monocytogenes FSL J1-194]EFK41033.1 conserved hypothetical protein [Listeria monocytogenes FSL N1-017]